MSYSDYIVYLYVDVGLTFSSATNREPTHEPDTSLLAVRHLGAAITVLLARSPATRLRSLADRWRAGQNTGARDFHAGTALATPDTRHDWKALSKRLFQHYGERIILPCQWARCGTRADPQRVPGSRGQASLHITPSSPFMPHDAQQRPIHPPASRTERQVYKKEQPNIYIVV